jgi:tRNA 2-thiouridine synthesizing protein C
MTEAPQSDPRIRRFMCINRRAPYGTSYALEGLEATLAAGAFNQDVSVVFMDDGVFALQRGQDTRASGLKNFSRTWSALESCGVDKVYVERESLEHRGLSAQDLLLAAQIIDAQALGALMDKQHVLLNF